jgi:multiple sugar transport system permease protein
MVNHQPTSWLKLLFAIPFLHPLLLLCIGALWPDYQSLSAFWLGPEGFRPSFDNFGTVANLVPVARFALNSLRVVLLAVPLALLVASLASFAIIRLPPRGQALMVWISLAALVAPPKALWIARFMVFKSFGWVDTPWPLVAPALLGGSPFYVLLLYGFLRSIPCELWEAAHIDGALPGQMWRYIALPLTREALLAVAVLHFLHVWGDFADPLLYLRSTAQMTLPVGLRLLTELTFTRWPVVMAGATLLALPAAGVFLVGQRVVHQYPIRLD